MTVDGNEIPAQAYFYWTAYNCSYFEYQLGMLAAYGMSGDLVNVEDGSVNWDAPFSEDQTSQPICQGGDEVCRHLLRRGGEPGRGAGRDPHGGG